MTKRKCYTAPWGSREIYKNGKPFLKIQRYEGPDQASPTAIDNAARRILKLLNKGGRC